MPFNNSDIPGFRHSQRTCDDYPNLFDLALSSKDNGQKCQAADKKRSTPYLFSQIHCQPHLLFRLFKLIVEQEAVCKHKVSKSYQVLIACFQNCSKTVATIRKRLFRCHIAIALAVSCYHCLEETSSLLCCTILLHNGLSLLDDNRHFLRSPAQREELVNL